MTTFAKFRRLGLDTGSVSLYPAPEGFRSGYDCTPIGAEVFGGAGVDGIHFCRIRGFGDMVFAVSPMNEPGNCVHPLAESFSDFLRLLLACGDTAALEQAHQWDASRFRLFLEENPPLPEGKAVLDALGSALELSPMPQPYDYIRRVQTGFDYSRLRFSKAHREVLASVTPKSTEPAEWKVRFGSTLYGDGSRGSTRPGREVRLDHVFRWGGEEWHIPAVYLCGGGVVVDFCARVDLAAMEFFWNKWAFKLKYGGLTDEERDAIRLESPMNISIRPSLTVNGKVLHWNHGSSSVWAPVFAETDEDTQDNHARPVLEHYGLDLNENWSVHRMSFPWATGRKPSIRSMVLTMIAEDTNIPGIRFTAKAGDEISFTHPTAGTEHLLTVLELQSLDIPNRMSEEDVEFPSHCIAMEYAVAPELEQNAVMLQDCDSGDPPRRKGGGKGGSSQSFGVIGAIVRSKDGPTMVTVRSSGSTSASVTKRSACSSLYFQPPETVEWQLSFRVKLRKDHTETLI